MRFSNDVDQYLRLVEDCRAALANIPGDTSVGIAPHSLRATSPEDLAKALQATPTGPSLIHSSEE